MAPSTVVHSDIVYGSEEGQTLDLSIPTPIPPNGCPLLVFVHGGAWRTRPPPTVLALFAHELIVASNYTLAVAIVRYRLSPQVQHPHHVDDVVRALGYLVDKSEEYGNYDPRRIILAGHSAGATICAQIAMDSQYLRQGLGVGHASDKLRRAIQGVCGLQGIYSLNELVKTFPEYTEFVAPAFGEAPAEWTSASPTHFPVTDWERGMRWLVIWSEEDELVDGEQARQFVKRVRQGQPKDIRFVDRVAWGSHDGVLEREEVWRALVDFCWQAAGMA